MNYTAVLAMLLGRFHFELALEVLVISPLVALASWQHGCYTRTQVMMCIRHCRPLSASHGCLVEVQMGGAEGVLNAEHMAMTLQPGGGLLMQVTRRELMTA